MIHNDVGTIVLGIFIIDEPSTISTFLIYDMKCIRRLFYSAEPITENAELSELTTSDAVYIDIVKMIRGTNIATCLEIHEELKNQDAVAIRCIDKDPVFND